MIISKTERYDRIFAAIFDVLVFLFMAMIKCPSCGREVEYEGNKFRPFCSERCNLIDLGAWIDEEYAVAAENEPVSEEDLDMIERSIKERGEAW